MLEPLFERGARLAVRRAEDCKAEAAVQLRAQLPRDIAVTEAADSIILSGRGLRRRFALDPTLRWLRECLR